MTTLVQPGRTAAWRPSLDHVQQALVFVTLVMATSMFLQRFGLPAGSKPVNVVGPIGLGLAGVGILRGTLTFSRIRLPLFLLLCALTLLGMAYRQIVPGRFQIPTILPSLLQFLILTSFATLSFVTPVPEREFMRRVTAVLSLVAVAGIIQFFVQFVGLGLFSFRGIVPPFLLFEDGYNLQISAGFGNALKSNGFFLLEPSIFSQIMAFGLILELLVLRRTRMLALFAAGLMLSMAGTGWIVLVAFVVSAAFSMGRRGILIAILTVALVGLLAGGALVLAPDAAASFSGRFDEITRQSTSGHLRFITPFWLLDDVLTDEPSAALLGIGSGGSERMIRSYEYTVNTPVKIIIDYGIPALLVYVALLAFGRKTITQRALVLPGLMLLLFTGGYQQFAPVLFPVLLVMTVANLTPDGGPAPWRPDHAADR